MLRLSVHISDILHLSINMTRNLKLYYQNVKGLRSRIKHGLKSEITLANFDIVSITESWLNANFNSSEIFDETFIVFRSDRSVEKYNLLKGNSNCNVTDDIRGGKCLLAIKNNISALREE